MNTEQSSPSTIKTDFGNWIFLTQQKYNQIKGYANN